MISELQKIVNIFDHALKAGKKYVSPTCLRVIKSFVQEEQYNLYRLHKGIKAVEGAVQKKEPLSGLTDKLMRYNSFAAESIWNFNRFSDQLIDSQEVYDFDAIDSKKYANQIEEGLHYDFVSLLHQVIGLYEQVNDVASQEIMPVCEIARAKRYIVHLEGVCKKLHDYVKAADHAKKMTKKDLKDFLKMVHEMIEEVVDCGFGITHSTVLFHNRCTLHEAQTQLADALKNTYSVQNRL